jgi:hypothetical protein
MTRDQSAEPGQPLLGRLAYGKGFDDILNRRVLAVQKERAKGHIIR